ncbi:prenyltransferase/squalene oxidase repeat-containing protein [Aporhodopirellula aestuarii]|uniref:Terpene cyclase/mutase family protein n=1 Tax=Aporhodopirellula aestuarii TaxID=2950107 RepID=A0ABT0TWI5_9BACT|nr:prenyltransferase/squalene oxidase repeat-containing protein [Aporhodopirellula aestuarii]MCM2369001.1 terpene cyclase/mutase family protein [Aporhodopirellula aestuarii]
MQDVSQLDAVTPPPTPVRVLPPRVVKGRRKMATVGEPVGENAVLPPPIATARGVVNRPKADRSQLVRGDVSVAHAEEQPKEKISVIAWRVIARMQKKVSEAPEWLVSLVFHVIVLLVLALITTSPAVVGRIVLTVEQGENEITTELAEFSLDPVEVPDTPSEESPSETELEIEPIQIETPVSFASISPKVVTEEASVNLPSTDLAGESLNMFAGRTGSRKQELLKAFGGTVETEDAVALGLDWLRRNQLKDGSWSLVGPYAHGSRSENQVSATAMAMLAFMGAGSTHRGGQYQKVLWRAVRWLVKQQDRDGFMAARAGDHEKMYSQAQAMIALCELYAMTGDSWIRPYAQASCNFACAAQSPQGGWRYRPRFDSDTSVSGWFLVGLKSGEAAGLEVDRYVFLRFDEYLNSVQADRANDYYAVGYSYQVGHAASPSMTAEGLLCRQYLGWHRNMPGMRSGLISLVQNHPMNPRERDVYYWYYATQALHHYGGPLWTQWNDKMKVDLPTAQTRRGAERGSWSPEGDAWGIYAGRLYTTCLSLYCLEVYYRHMPIYSPLEVAEAEELDEA